MQTLQRLVIKIGGRAFENPETFLELADGIKASAVPTVLVHGGGAEISQALKDANRDTVFIDGVRVTEKEDMAIVERVLSETVNSRIAAHLQRAGLKPQRLSGKSEGLFIAERMTRNGKNIGFVGRVKTVNPQVIESSLQTGHIPVVSPVSANADGDTYNINADTATAALAQAVNATDLIYFSDVPGILIDGAVQPQLTVEQGRALIANGAIYGGMVAKLESIFDALHHGVDRVHITQWKHSNMLSLILQNQHVEKTTIIESPGGRA